MIKEDKLEKLRQTVSERTRQQQDKQVLLEKALSQRFSPPQAGDIFVHPKTAGFRWVTLDIDENQPQRFLTVPADDAPLVGSTDVKLPDGALCSPLTLRCDQGLFIHNTDFRKLRRVGILEEWHRLRALDKVKQIAEHKFRVGFQIRLTKLLKLLHRGLPKLIYRWMGDITQLKSSVLHQRMNYEPDYVEWKGKVRKAMTALALAIPSPGTLSKPSQTFWEGGKIRNVGHHLIFVPHKAVYALGVVILTVLAGTIFNVSQNGDDTNQMIPAQSSFLVITSDSSFQAIQATLSKSFHAAWKGQRIVMGSHFSAYSPPSDAMKAFSAGIWHALQELRLLSSSEMKEDWLKQYWLNTEWDSYFKLGHWALSLEVMCQSAFLQYQAPNAFWEKQKQVFAKLKMDFDARWKKNDEAEELEVEEVTLVFEKIGPLLESLPNDTQAESYAELGKYIHDMRIYLIPKFMENEQ